MIKRWNIEAMTGYKPITTFYEDFYIADAFSTGAIKDTFQNCFRYWRSDYRYLTELVMVLDWKIWEHNETKPEYAELYNELWIEASEWAVNNLKGEKLKYYYRTTD